MFGVEAGGYPLLASEQPTIPEVMTMRYMRVGDHERCDFDPEKGYVVMTEAEFTSVFGFPSKTPSFPKVEDRRELWVRLAVFGRLPRHLEAAVKTLVEGDDDWTEAYSRVRDLPLPGENWDIPPGFPGDDEGEGWKRRPQAE